jgi:putative peptide zinc metalloprotease protein
MDMEASSLNLETGKSTRRVPRMASSLSRDATPGIPLLACRPRGRRDLRFRISDNARGDSRQSNPDSGRRWTVLDPISRQCFRIGLIEHWILTRVDGTRNVRQLLQALRTEHTSIEATDEQLLAIVDMLVRHSLLSLPERPCQVVTSDQSVRSWLSSLVVWQIRGVQPDGWLSVLAPHTNLFFSALAVRSWLVIAVLTGMALALDFHRLAAQSLSLDWILRPTTGGLLFVVFIATRAVHELGHAIVCKRFGIRVPDIGLFIILGAPCVYCDVSESWQLPNRWQRAAVAAAGIYVELIVATVATWAWLLTVDGPANLLALQTMLVCSVSTLVINANPLMRFDGYYLLTDWLDEVNLRSRADAVGRNFLRRLLLGVPLPHASRIASSRNRFLLLFSLAGWIYRGLLSLTIATILIALYSGWNLAWVGRFLAAAILFSWWGIPLMKVSSELYSSARTLGRRWRLAAATAALLLGLAFLPIPNRRFADGWLQPAETQGVYASASAQLIACFARDGQSVTEDEPLFELESGHLCERLVRYQLATQVAEIRLEANMRRRNMYGQDVDLQRASNELEETRTWAKGAERDVAALTLRAPASGRLVAMPISQATVPYDSLPRGRSSEGSSVLSTWCDGSHIGRYVREGSLLACVCSQRLIAVIPLNESQLATIATGTRVHVRISQTQTVLTKTRVAAVVQIDELSSPWQNPSITSHSTETPASPRFAAVIELPSETVGLPGSTVDAVFWSESTTSFKLLSSWLHSNLRLLAD